MTWYAVHDNEGTLVSVGTVLADPFPEHLTAVPLTDEQADAFRGGHGEWDDKTLTVIVLPPPEQQPTLEDLYSGLIDVLVDKGVVTAEDVKDVKPDPKETGEVAVPVDAVVADVKR